MHDWFQGYHGSERVVEALLSDCFPGADTVDLYAFSAERSLLPDHLANAIVRDSRLARAPVIRQRGHEPGYWRYLLPYMPRYFEHLALDSYDLVVSSSHSCALAAHGANAVNVCYCHTPMRYLWRSDADTRSSGASAAVMTALSPWLKRRDVRSAARVEHFAANSRAVAQRIRTVYGREATVIHPPVDVDQLDHTRPKDRDHFLWVGRFVSYKQPELVLEAFRGLDLRLTMVGVGPLAATLRASASPNVEILDWVDRDDLVELYARAGGFVHIGEEDFGIATVEALGSGTPVVACAAGGALDTVRPGVDGLLVDDLSVESVRRAVLEMRESSWDAGELAARAARFGRARFADELRGFIEEVWR